MKSSFKSVFCGALLALTALAGISSPARAIVTADPNASDATRATLSYIKALQGANLTLSCQQLSLPWIQDDMTAYASGECEATRINQLTGQYPAMIGLDFHSCDAYPDHGASVIRMAEDWSARGGLVEFTWHESNPRSYSGDAADSTDGFYSSLSASEWNDLLNNPNSTLYSNWMHHMALLGNWLGQLQQAGVTVLWRPLHEGDGTWFWWGGNPSNYIALWQQEFNVLTNTYGLHNLIWVDSTPNGSYYPGSNFVDAGGGDIYSSNQTDPTYQNVYNTVTGFIGDRASALTECGLFPDQNYAHNGIRYAWVNNWGGSFLDSGYYPVAPLANGQPDYNTIAECNTAANVQTFYSDPRTVNLSGVAIPTTYLQSGHTYNIVNAYSGMALDDSGWATAPGSPVEQWDDWRGAPQQWTITDVGNGNWTIVNAYNQLALDDYGWGTANGTEVDQWTNWGGPPQQWRIYWVGDGTFNIVNYYSNLALETYGWSQTHGAAVDLWQNFNAANQHWLFQLVN